MLYFLLFVVIFYLFIRYYISRIKVKNEHEYHQYYIKPNRVNLLGRTTPMGVIISDNENNVQMALNHLKETDPKFNETDFFKIVNKTFNKIHEAINKQDIEIVRPYLTDAIIQRYLNQIEDLKSNGEKHVLDKININSICFMDVQNDHNYNYITVKIDADYNVNYIINKKNERRCINNDDKNVVEYWTFIRAIDKSKNKKVKKDKCPNCGAKIAINTNTKCDYCYANVIIEKYDWVLSQIDKSL